MFLCNYSSDQQQQFTFPSKCPSLSNSDSFSFVSIFRGRGEGKPTSSPATTVIAERRCNPQQPSVINSCNQSPADIGRVFLSHWHEGFGLWFSVVSSDAAKVRDANKNRKKVCLSKRCLCSFSARPSLVPIVYGSEEAGGHALRPIGQRKNPIIII